MTTVRANAVNDYAGHSTSLRIRPQLIPAKVTNPEKPTPIFIGVARFYSLPIGTGADDEYVLYLDVVPRRWDGVSNITFMLMCAVDTAQAGTKDFQIRISWNHFADGAVLPVPIHNVDVPQSTGVAAQYKTFRLRFTINYLADGAGNEVKVGEDLAIQVYRIACPGGAGSEIAGEVLISGAELEYNRDKLGVAV